MPSTNAFQPIWPPVDEVNFHALPEVRQARDMYRAQKDSLVALIEQADGSRSGTETYSLSQQIAAQLHNISGTGAYFDDSEFGHFAGEMEHPVRGAFTADLLRPLCRQITDRLALDETG